MDPQFVAGATSPVVGKFSGAFAVWELALDPEFASRGLAVVENVFAVAARQKAQRGLFTRIQTAKHLDLASLLSDIERGHLLTCYGVRAGDAVRALWDLERMNITYATLFPDLEGAARQANLSFGRETISPRTRLGTDLRDEDGDLTVPGST